MCERRRASSSPTSLGHRGHRCSLSSLTLLTDFAHWLEAIRCRGTLSNVLILSKIPFISANPQPKVRRTRFWTRCCLVSASMLFSFGQLTSVSRIVWTVFIRLDGLRSISVDQPDERSAGSKLPTDQLPHSERLIGHRSFTSLHGKSVDLHDAVHFGNQNKCLVHLNYPSTSPCLKQLNQSIESFPIRFTDSTNPPLSLPPTDQNNLSYLK